MQANGKIRRCGLNSQRRLACSIDGKAFEPIGWPCQMRWRSYHGTGWPSFAITTIAMRVWGCRLVQVRASIEKLDG